MMEKETSKLVRCEMERARAKFPDWPRDGIHAAAIVCEEAGELIRAALRHRYEGGSTEDMREEALHVAATACRFLEGW